MVDRDVTLASASPIAPARPIGRTRPGGFRLRRTVLAIAKYGVLGFWAFLCLYPMLLVVSTALKNPTIETGNPFDLFSSIHVANFERAWTLGNFGAYFLNTVAVMVPTVLGVVVLSTMAGYAFARFEFPFKTLLFYLFILGLMVPFFALMIPLYYNLRDYGLLDTLPAVILPSIAGAGGTGLPMGVFLMRAFFLDMPDELADAGRVDGCTEFGVFRHVMLPLAAPGAAALAILAFLSAWNTFLLPLLYLPSQEHWTLAMGLLVFTGGRTRELELTAAGTLIMIAPVVLFFLLFQRQFIRGLTAGAVKG
ncbi:MAG TPA: carbohydrate ABC transporter permease [Candidatus Limnocylindrales bacterium]|jgi:ABC-type glycerol-3-phosphate transport system permease component|nr:carbohydrate ABC transporter permease [Candidatus Limnocylindrales bacterium]